MFKKPTTLVLAVVVVIATVGMPVAAAGGAYDGTFSEQTLERAGFVSGTFDADGVVSYGGDPGWYVTVDNGSLDSLRTWANASGRDLVATDTASNRALVAAAPADIGVRGLDRLLDRGLAGQSYVERIDVAARMSYAEPVDALQNESVYEAPAGARAAATLTSASMDGFTADGQAWRGDTPHATPAQVQADINADGVSVDGTGVRVAVIDTGLNADAANDALYQNRTAAPLNTITDTETMDAVADGNGHGSWVAGMLAADPDTSQTGEAYEGVAPNATIIPVKALSDEGSGSTQDIVEGIEHASEHNADIISMSLGSAVYNPTIAAEIEEFFEEGGTAVYVATGNSKLNPATRYISSPADVDGVIAVGATNASPAATAAPAYFSEVGPDNGVTDLSNGVTNGEAPDVAAPGMNVSAAVKSTSGLRSNKTLSGTSMATPVAAGVGALMLDANPTLEGDAESFREHVLETAVPVPAAGVTEVGHGMVDGANATALTATEQSQADARTDTAKARDLANRGYSNSRTARLFYRISGGDE